jgi:hypothetical protein
LPLRLADRHAAAVDWTEAATSCHLDGVPVSELPLDVVAWALRQADFKQLHPAVAEVAVLCVPGEEIAALTYPVGNLAGLVGYYAVADIQPVGAVLIGMPEVVHLNRDYVGQLV